MPNGNCHFPEHHQGGPSAGPVIAWVAALGLGALIMSHWHTFVLILVVLGILTALAVPMFLLWHNHGSGYDPDLERQAAAERRAASYSITSGSSPAVATAERTAALEAAPFVHQHLHLHGLSADEMATVTRKAIEPPRDSAW